SPAALASMAATAARAIEEADATGVRLTYDVSRYTGPVLHPISPNDNIAPVTALMVNEGRLNGTDRGHAPRTDDPAGDAARAFAAQLKKAGVKVTGAPREARAPGKARTVATHHSAPLSALVERTLTNS
ncbi:D-alanyl-D-alanine carboxypeptidase, partial [Streptomyces sp. SID8455]|nr:D-alanyl-D-alanine carboxypeptidase [Streptomyces sp. SID8455]